MADRRHWSILLLGFQLLSVDGPLVKWLVLYPSEHLHPCSPRHVPVGQKVPTVSLATFSLGKLPCQGSLDGEIGRGCWD